jgi:hypothetical protein
VTFPPDEEIARLRERAAGAAARAAAEERRAERAAALARDGSSSLRDMHRSMAELHGRNAGIHRTTARLYDGLAARRELLLGPADETDRVDRSGHRSMAVVAAGAIGAPSLAIALLTGDRELTGLAATDQTSDAAHELEFALGEGPLHEAILSDRVVVAAAETLEHRWPHYAGAVDSLGVRAVVAAPLRHDDASFGAIGVFGSGDALPSAEALQQVADVLVEELVRELRQQTRGDAIPQDWFEHVQRAAGVVSAHLGCDLETAVDLLRARGFADGVTTKAVADRVLSGDLTLDL